MGEWWGRVLALGMECDIALLMGMPSTLCCACCAVLCLLSCACCARMLSCCC